MISKINGSVLYHNNKNGKCVNCYYEYVVSLIGKILSENNALTINVILGKFDYDFDNTNKTIKIDINYEHTLVKTGGRSVPRNTPKGVVEYGLDSKYLVRIDKYQSLNRADIVIDYSKPNIYNVEESGLFNDFSKKHVYVSPSLYGNLYLNKEDRNILSLTTFINTNEPRRKRLLSRVKNSNVEHINVNNCFDKRQLRELYKRTKVLINIHQTDHHDTFEELRVLPALQCGIVVISENSPLSHLIPYNDLIIWSNYDNMLQEVHNVISNYDNYHDSIFCKENIRILDKLNGVNYDKLNKNIVAKSAFTPT